jgi:AbrB family looped-hinge helix DNA binding protein
MFIEGFGYTMQVDLDTVHSITETALTIRGSRRRITVPAEIVEQLELKDGDKLRWIAFKDKSIYVQKVQ